MKLSFLAQEVFYLDGIVPFQISVEYSQYTLVEIKQ